MMAGRWLKLTAALWLLRKAFKVIGWLLARRCRGRRLAGHRRGRRREPAAWLRGWPPARLWRAAVWSLPMTAVYAGRPGDAAAAPGRPSRWPRS